MQVRERERDIEVHFAEKNVVSFGADGGDTPHKLFTIPSEVAKNASTYVRERDVEFVYDAI